MSTNLKPEKVKLHASFASIFYLTDDAAGYYIGAFALTNIGTAHSASVRGYSTTYTYKRALPGPGMWRRPTVDAAP